MRCHSYKITEMLWEWGVDLDTNSHFWIVEKVGLYFQQEITPKYDSWSCIHNQVSNNGVLLTRNWWKADFCHWMPGMVFTWGCYSPGRRSWKMRRIALFFLPHTNAVFTITDVSSLRFVRRAWGGIRDASLSVGAVGRYEGAAGMGSRVQGNLGQGSYSVFEKIPCCAVSGTVFFSIDGHSEFCGASLKNALMLPATVIFSVTPPYRF